MSLSIGTRLGSYEILAPIGAGGMGEVYRAKDTKLGRDVALKVLPDAFARDPERMERFEREAHVLASLNHPHIAAIHGLEDAGGVRALVMELVEGPTLSHRIGGRAMSLDDALPIASQIAEGLEYAHERGVIHRDLKPANVKLTDDGQVKLLDFGLAKALEGPQAPAGNPSISPTLTLEGTRAGVILGTAAYMSPEQARGAVVNKRADIWAFGVVLYEMLTGRKPFSGETVSDTLAAVLTTEPDWEAVPPGMRRLVRRCLKKDPKRRLRDIGDASLAIEEQLAGDVTPEAAPKRATLWKVTAAVLALIAAVSLAGWWRSTQPVSHPLMRLRVDLGSEFAVTATEFEVTGTGASMTLSPDGTAVVYTGRGTDGRFRLYARALSQEQAAPLLGTEGGHGPFFSPDGQSVGFFAGGKLKKISVRGGGAVVLCDAPASLGGSWSEDGNIVAALNFSGGLSRVPAVGGPVRPVTQLLPEKKDVTHRFPQVLPGSRAVLFMAHTAGTGFDEATIEVQSLRTGERRTLVRGGYYGRYVPSGHLLYVHQGTLYAAPLNLNRLKLTGPPAPVVEDVASNSTFGFAQVDFSRTGTLAYMKGQANRQSLVWLDSTGHTLRSTVGEFFGPPRFSPDGKRLALSLVDGGSTDVWVYEWERATMTRLTFAPENDALPVWSPNGKHIVFASDREGGVGNLYWMRADGAGEVVRLTESKNLQRPFSFSPDGKRLAFSELSPQTNWDLWTISLEAPESDHPKPGKTEPFLATPFNETFPMISPDGRWLAYCSDESGNFEVYVRRFPGSGGKTQISTGGGDRPVWSGSGKELFYGNREGLMVATYTVNSEAFAAGKQRLWAGKKNFGYFDLAPERMRFAVVQAEASGPQGPAHVTFLLNFFDELSRRAPSAIK